MWNHFRGISSVCMSAVVLLLLLMTDGDDEDAGDDGDAGNQNEVDLITLSPPWSI